MGRESDRRNILFIDDDDAFRQVTTEVLDCLGHGVRAVNSLSSAIIALRHTEFDLILSDLCISGDRDGLLILDFLDSAGIEVPVIFITGSSGGEWFDPENMGERSIGLLKKPVTMAQLAGSIESFCPRRHAIACRADVFRSVTCATV